MFISYNVCLSKTCKTKICCLLTALFNNLSPDYTRYSLLKTVRIIYYYKSNDFLTVKTHNKDCSCR